MTHDLNQFRIYRFQADAFEADLSAIIQHYQDSYFSGGSTLAAQFVPSFEGPSRIWPDKNLIEIDERLCSFIKLCCFLVLHELIHYKLYKKHGQPQSDNGDEFQAEVKRLWGQGAYKGLL